LEVDVLALTLIRIESVEAALHDESRESDELSEGTDLLLGGVPEGVLLSISLHISDIYCISERTS
jgi:hypothetical protein